MLREERLGGIGQDGDEDESPEDACGKYIGLS
jgi:hypothetical protein